jgi:hypothetical protein
MIVRGYSDIYVLVYRFRRLRALLWNRFATLQDTHDQESNAPSTPLAKLGFQLCTG